MQTAAALAAVKSARLDPHDRFLGITEPAKPEKPTGCASFLAHTAFL